MSEFIKNSPEPQTDSHELEQNPYRIEPYRPEDVREARQMHKNLGSKPTQTKNMA